MAQTFNEEWQDVLIRHQVGIQMVAGGVRNEVLALLEATEEDLRQRLITSANRQAIYEYVRNLRGGAWREVRVLMRDRMQELVVAEAGFVERAMTALSPVVLDLARPDESLLRRLVRFDAFQGRVLNEWVSRTAAFDTDRINQQIRIGLAAGEGNDQITRRVLGTRVLRGTDGAVQTSKQAAAALVRTATNHFGNQSRQEFYKENRSIFTHEVFRATLDARTTFICASLDGRTFPIGTGQVPPIHFNCRSTRVPVIDPIGGGERPAVPTTQRMLLREFTRQNKLNPVRRRADLPHGTRGRFDTFARTRKRQLIGRVPARETYQGWLRRQSASFQDEVLGPTRGRLFRQGGLTLDKFVDRQGGVLTLAQLRRLDESAFRRASLD